MKNHLRSLANYAEQKHGQNKDEILRKRELLHALRNQREQQQIIRTFTKRELELADCFEL